MEVTNVRDHVTHAIVGGGAAEACGISDSAEFFHILSSTLYRDKKLAVIRETLCNGWDAHVEAGIEDIALEIKLDADKLVIRDFGSGISKNVFRDIYGVYGGSTKKKNKLVTGGFGLGCKAPWAYVDHFQVTSYHDGEQTIYNLSKSSAQVNGRPMITPIVTIPTEDSGLEVSINIRHPHDVHEFRALITRIAAMGEMRVKLNGEVLATVPFSKADNGYLLFRKGLAGNDQHKIFVRYGHVVYPVESDGAYVKNYNRLVGLLQSVNGNHYGYSSNSDDWVIAVQAEANTVSVTPSRESLSMTDHTIGTLSRLLEAAAKALDGRLEKTCERLNEANIEATWIMDRPASLLELGKMPHLKAIPEPVKRSFVTDVDELGGAYMRRSYPDFGDFRERDFQLRIDALAKGGFGPPGLVRGYREELAKVKGRGNADTDWFHRRFLWPVMRRMSKSGLDAKNLFVYTHGRLPRGYQEGETFVEASKFSRKPLRDYLPFLRGIVIVGYNRTAVLDRAQFFPACKHWFGKPLESLTYFVKRGGERAKEAVQYFESLGFHVLDLTKYHPWEDVPEPVAKDRSPTPKKARPKGFPLLSSALDPSAKTGLSTGPLYDEANPTRTDRTPEFVAIIGEREELSEYGTWDLSVFKAVVRAFGARGVVVRNSVQADKLYAAGAKTIQAFVREEISRQVLTNPELEQHYRNSISPWVSNTLPHEVDTLASIILKDGPIRKSVGLPQRATEHVRDLATILNAMGRYEMRTEEMAPVRKALGDWLASKKLQQLYDALRKNKTVLSMIAEHKLVQILNHPINEEDKATVRNFILTTLKRK